MVPTSPLNELVKKLRHVRFFSDQAMRNSLASWSRCGVLAPIRCFEDEEEDEYERWWPDT